MAKDVNGKGFIVGSTVTISPTVVSVVKNVATVKMPDGTTTFTNSPKSAMYSAGATPSITGTVIGFINGGISCVVLEADGNMFVAPNSSVTAT